MLCILRVWPPKSIIVSLRTRRYTMLPMHVQMSQIEVMHVQCRQSHPVVNTATAVRIGGSIRTCYHSRKRLRNLNEITAMGQRYTLKRFPPNKEAITDPDCWTYAKPNLHPSHCACPEGLFRDMTHPQEITALDLCSLGTVESAACRIRCQLATLQAFPDLAQRGPGTTALCLRQPG